MHKVLILSRDAQRYADLWSQQHAFQDVTLVLCTTAPDEVIKHLQANEITILLSDPDLAVQVIDHLPNLIWCQSAWAGNAPLLRHPKQDYMLSGVKGIFAQLMSEYVLSYILAHVRQHVPMRLLQSQQRWQPPHIGSISQLTIGILGLGHIATGMLPVFSALNANVIGLSRRATPPRDFPQMQMFSDTQRHEFVEQCDVLVNLLPDTPHTQGYLNHELINGLSPKPRLFINAGRGSVIADEVLLSALQQKVFEAAILDVFTSEPLAPEHEFWGHPRITVTQHTAAISVPDDVMQIFLDNFTRLTQGQTPHYLMNWEQGY
jgi:phosphoglycerate dehydrogenase-like enzyme